VSTDEAAPTAHYQHEWQQPRVQAGVHFSNLENTLAGAQCEWDEIADGNPQWTAEDWSAWERKMRAALSECSAFMAHHFRETDVLVENYKPERTDMQTGAFSVRGGKIVRTGHVYGSHRAATWGG
jgi:hypothetical protein